MWISQPSSANPMPEPQFKKKTQYRVLEPVLVISVCVFFWSEQAMFTATLTMGNQRHFWNWEAVIRSNHIQLTIQKPAASSLPWNSANKERLSSWYHQRKNKKIHFRSAAMVLNCKDLDNLHPGQTQIHRYTNTQIHKYTNTKIQKCKYTKSL